MTTIEQLKTSAARLMENRPAYKDILRFYSRVFEMQEKSRQEINVSPIVIEPDLLTTKKENQMPLIDPSQFKIDDASAVKLLHDICDLSQDLAPDLASDAKCIKQGLSDGNLDSKQLFSSILNSNPDDLDELSKKLNVGIPKLNLFGFLSMAPSISTGAQQLETYLDKDSTPSQGYCPICGHPPDLAVLDEEGKRSLKCSFCQHQWATKRVGCVFCQNTEPEKQQYFFSNDEKEYRVNLCDNCSNYIKVVDLRQMNRFFHPGLELISTLHLDIKAKEKGYISSTSL